MWSIQMWQESTWTMRVILSPCRRIGRSDPCASSDPGLKIRETWWNGSNTTPRAVDIDVSEEGSRAIDVNVVDLPGNDVAD
jgi:hypothetical protein